MAPNSESQTVKESDRQNTGKRVDAEKDSTDKIKKRCIDGVNSRGGRKRHAGSLPMCQVCFNPGSGFHYGADTCEPCKTFFRRNVSCKDKLECRKGNTCKPTASKKFKCTACRLQRCLDVGMSIEGIKLGRYTDAKRAQNKAVELGKSIFSSGPITKQDSPTSTLSFLLTPPVTPEEDHQEISTITDISPTMTNKYSDIVDEGLVQCNSYDTGKTDKEFGQLTLANTPLVLGSLQGGNQITAVPTGDTMLQQTLSQVENSFLGQLENSIDSKSFTEVQLTNNENLHQIQAKGSQSPYASSQISSLNKLGNILPDYINQQSDITTLDSMQTSGEESTLSDPLLLGTFNQQDKIARVKTNIPDMHTERFLGSEILPISNSERDSVPYPTIPRTVLPISVESISQPTLNANTQIDLTLYTKQNNQPNDTDTSDNRTEPTTLEASSLRLTAPKANSNLLVPDRSMLSMLYSDAEVPAHQQLCSYMSMLTSTTIPAMVPENICDSFIDNITYTYNRYDAHGPDFFHSIHRMFMEYLESQKVRKRMFGSLRPLPLSEYREILLETGLDVDGRLQQLTHRQLPSYENGYALYLGFAQSVWGFKDLPLEDQDILLKGARVHYWMLSEYDCFNIEMGLHALPEGFVMGMDDKALVFERNFILGMFRAAGKFQKLGLTERERNLLKCVYLFSRGNSCTTPEGIATANRHYNFYKQMLQYCREKEGRLSISSELDRQLEPLMKDLEKLEEKDWEEFFSLWKDFPMIKFPPVIKSFYFGSPTFDLS